MAGCCSEFGISRKTGYKIYHRYQDCGIDGLTDRSRRPYRHGIQLEFIRPGKPVENSFIESSNGHLRGECLNVEIFFSVQGAQEKLERCGWTTISYAPTPRFKTRHRSLLPSFARASKQEGVT